MAQTPAWLQDCVRSRSVYDWVALAAFVLASGCLGERGEWKNNSSSDQAYSERQDAGLETESLSEDEHPDAFGDEGEVEDTGDISVLGQVLRRCFENQRSLQAYDVYLVERKTGRLVIFSYLPELDAVQLSSPEGRRVFPIPIEFNNDVRVEWFPYIKLVAGRQRQRWEPSVRFCTESWQMLY